MRIPYISYSGYRTRSIIVRITKRSGESFEGTLQYLPSKTDITQIRGTIKEKVVKFTEYDGESRSFYTLELTGNRLIGDYRPGGSKRRIEIKYLRNDSRKQ